jgi:hypothetical protein
MPRLSAAMAPFGGGNFASSSVINVVPARAEPEPKRATATHATHIAATSRLFKNIPSV